MGMGRRRSDLHGAEFYTIIIRKLNHTHIYLVLVAVGDLGGDDIVGGDDKVLNMPEIL